MLGARDKISQRETVSVHMYNLKYKYLKRDLLQVLAREVNMYKILIEMYYCGKPTLRHLAVF